MSEKAWLQPTASMTDAEAQSAPPSVAPVEEDNDDDKPQPEQPERKVIGG